MFSIKSSNLSTNTYVLNFLLSFATGILFLAPASAAVWETKNYWDEYTWEKYSRWIESDEVTTDFLHQKYKQATGKKLAINCADLIYGLYLWFAFENKLPFETINNRFRKSYAHRTDNHPWSFRKFSNEMKNFDSIQDPNKRFFKFFSKIRDGLETASLAKWDAYPISFKSARAGDFYTWDMKDSKGEITRHTYLIKKVYPNGTLGVFYSTQERERKFKTPNFIDKVDPSYFKRVAKQSRLDNVDAFFGLTRFRPFSYQWGIPLFSNAIDDISFPNYSLEQFDVAKSKSWGMFFDIFRSNMEKIAVTLSEKITQKLNTTCNVFQERVSSVLSAVSHSKTIGSRCITGGGEYDSYSTPVSDSGRIRSLKSLASYYAKAREELCLTDPSLNQELCQSLDALFKAEAISKEEDLKISKLCSFNIAPADASQRFINLRTIVDALRLGNPEERRSSQAFHYNPNTKNYLVMWGLEAPDSKIKKCQKLPRYYDYPPDFFFPKL